MIAKKIRFTMQIPAETVQLGRAIVRRFPHETLSGMINRGLLYEIRRYNGHLKRMKKKQLKPFTGKLPAGRPCKQEE